MDMTAFTLCKENDLPIVVFDMDTPGNFKKLMAGEQVGTMMAGMLSTSTAESLRQSVSTLESLGCDELFLVPTTTDVTELNRTRDALGI